jgi:hypothetical protein
MKRFGALTRPLRTALFAERRNIPVWVVVFGGEILGMRIKKGNKKRGIKKWKQKNVKCEKDNNSRSVITSQTISDQT